MYATQSSRLGVPRQATVTPLMRRRRRPSTFASGFLLLPSIVLCTSRKRRSPCLRCDVGVDKEHGPPTLRAPRFQCQGLVCPRKGRARRARRESYPRGIRESSRVCSPWTNGPSYFGDALVSPHQIGRFCRLWIVVDKWISCEHFWCRACREEHRSPARDETLEDQPCENRPARDESGEVADRRRALVEQLQGFVGRVHAAGRDDLEVVAEDAARPPPVVQRGREDVGSREPALAL